MFNISTTLSAIESHSFLLNFILLFNLILMFGKSFLKQLHIFCILSIMEPLTLLRLHGLYQGTLHASFLKELTTTCHTYECKSTNAIFLLTSSLFTFLLWRIGINLLDILFFKGFEEVVVWHLVLVVEGYVHYFAWYLLATDLLLCVN